MNDSSKPIHVGVIGLGMMGLTHLDAYAKLPGVKVAAVADLDDDRLSGKTSAAGNIEGQAEQGFDLTAAGLKKYRDDLDLIADPDIDVVDICVPTPGHSAIALASLGAGKHTLIEKPLVRTHDQAQPLIDAAATAWDQHGAVSMCAMCMRFWPGWDWLKQAVEAQTYGHVHAATFRRVASHPGGPFYSDGDACGGAILDLHIHDSDFVRHLFGEPADVDTRGYRKTTGQPDHVLSTYHFAPGTPGLADDALVAAEGGWAMDAGFGFS
ncbi:MAG: Gfo/Idh/MocA family oxidoreductase, partial [Planctomycetota bacterium]